MTYKEALDNGYKESHFTWPKSAERIPIWSDPMKAVVKTATRGKYKGELYVELFCSAPGHVTRAYLSK